MRRRHFHVRGPDSEAQIGIEHLNVMRGYITRADHMAAISYAKANRAALLAKWRELNERD